MNSYSLFSFLGASYSTSTDQSVHTNTIWPLVAVAASTALIVILVIGLMFR